MTSSDASARRPRPAAFLPALLVALLLAALGLPSAARAQSDRFQVDVMAGVGSPRGDLAKVNVDGVMGSLGLGYRITPRLTLRLDGAVDALQRGGSPLGSGTPVPLGGVLGPRTDLWHYMAGVAAELTTPDAGPWEVSALGQVGGTYVDEKGSPAVAPFQGHEATLYGGFMVGYDVIPALTIVARAGSYLLIGKASDPQGSFEGKEFILTDQFGLRLNF